MTISTGMFATLATKLETAWNVPDVTTTGAQLLRRTQATFDLVPANYKSNEIRPNRQIADFRLGTRAVQGKLSAELAPAAFTPTIIATVLAGATVTGVNTGAITTVTAAASAPGTFTRSAGSFITDGFKIGDIVRWTGWATTGAANNSRNYRITALSATVMTVGTAATGAVGGPEAVTAKASGDSVTCTVTGKKIVTPAAGSLVDTSFAFERWFSDISKSELYTGCKASQVDFSLPPTGLATIAATIMGGALTTGTSQYYTSPSALDSSGLVAAVNGTLRVGSTDIATVTGLTISVKGGHTTAQVAGSQFTPGVFPGQLDVSGQITALFDSTTLRDFGLAETPISLNAVLTCTSAINSDFIAFNIPRLKLTGWNKDDPFGAIAQTLGFQALDNTAFGGAGTTGDIGTLCIQDSLTA